MERFIKMAILVCSVWTLEHASASGMGSNARTDISEEEKEIEKMISLAPEHVLSLTNDVRVYREQVCRRISKVPDAQTRYRYFRELMESACRVSFERVEDAVQQDQNQESWVRARKTANLRLGAYYRLEGFAEEIWLNLFAYEQTLPPGGDLFEPWFMLIKKLKSEGKRQGNVVLRMLEANVNRVESLYLFIYLRDPRRISDEQDRAAVEARFKQVVGRPIRSAEQYKADARQRTEGNIKEHQKQQETNRRALEFQRKYNREHNINEP